jgi:hypothetical protein
MLKEAPIIGCATLFIHNSATADKNNQLVDYSWTTIYNNKFSCCVPDILRVISQFTK